ncbi:BspA family leucine-rich repeat surface protein [Ellagibacter isourolithinifaciens]|uniref:BspA family leucine-rich repeat surface protein n=1 Tax=Ellagibacter isourolithinifaciens TaxID=2137581 RepID=UPI003AF17311
MGKSRICMKTITSIALSVVLALGLLPAQAFAEVGDAATAAIPQAVSTSTRDDASSVEPSIDPSIGSEGVDDLEESYSAESGENAFTPEEADEGNQASDSSFASPEGEEGIAPEAAEGSGFGTLAVNSYAVLYDSDGDGTGDKLVFQSSTLNLSKYGAKVSSWQFAAEQTKFTSSSPAPWYDARSTVKSAVFNNPLSPTSLAYWFYGMSSLESVDLSNLDASGVKSMSHMFDGCSKLASLDLSPLDTSEVAGMSHMFDGCWSLASLDLSPLDTSEVADMSYMFYGCSKLASLDLSSLDTSKVADMSSMFCGCSSLATIYASASFSTESCTQSGFMFKDCTRLKGGSGTVCPGKSSGPSNSDAGIEKPRARIVNCLPFLGHEKWEALLWLETLCTTSV